MIDLGIVRPGTTLYIPFQTFSSDDPSASMTLTGLATTDIEIYKDGSTTQRASDSGYALLDTDGIDFDGITGIHGFSVDLADNTTAGFYAAGSQYWIVISSVTVDAATINFIAATFRIGYPAAILNTTIATLSSQTSFTLTSGPAEDDALNGMEIVIHDVASAVQMGRAVILDYTGSTKTVTLAAGTTFTAAASDNVAVIGPSPLQPTTSGNKLDVSSGGEAGIDWANVGTPGSTVNLSATTVKTATDVETDTADIQSRLPAALVSGRMDSNMQAAANGVITAAVIATDAIDADALAADAIAEINATVDTALADIKLDHLVAVADADDVVDNSIIAKMVSKSATADWSGFVNTTDSLEALRDRGDAAWITATGFSTHSAADVWSVATRVLTAATNITAAIADQVWEEAIADHSGTAGSTAEALNAAGSAGDPWTTTLPGSYTGSQAGKILSDILTDTGTTLDGKIDAIDDYIDSEVSAIKAKTDQLTFGTANRVNSQVYGFEADSITNAAFDNATGKQVIRANTLQSATASTATLDASASSVDDNYTGTWLYLTAGTGSGQCRMIAGYDGTTKVATIRGKNWATNPDNTTEFSILPAAYVYGAQEIYAGGIYPGSIAADAITASALATDAVTEIQSGLATASALSTVAGYIDTEVAAIKAKTDNLPAAPAATGDCITAAGVRTAVGLASANLDTQLDTLPTAVENADALLGRNIAGGSSTGRTVSQALYVLRNKVVTSGTTLTVYQTDDTTSSWTATLTLDAAADPITAVDPP